MTVVSTTGRVHIRGPLAVYVEGFEAELTRLGFAPASVVNQLHLVAHLSRWLDAQRLDAEDLTVERVETFIGERRAEYTALFSHRALRPLLGWLATSGVIAAEVASPRLPDDPAVLDRFEEYLLSERRLQAGTTAAHMARVRRFLNGYAPPGGLAELTAAEVTRALLDEGEGRAPVSVKKFGYALRAFLRFCLVTGEVEHNLTGATLVIRSPQPSLLPVGVSPAQVEALLEACDRDTALGRREYAVIVLLVRLGLRAGEVAGLRLEDIDWHHGEVLIRGKGARQECLPLPVEVGQAVADYLMHARPADAGHREVFCAVRAPRRGLTSGSVWAIVNRACERAGLEHVGPHRLRHSLGEAMVAAEVSLAAIGQVLRHDDPVTTANYARVDVSRLRSLAQPWPTHSPAGGERP
jgi:site-specific recombinase XerD